MNAERSRETAALFARTADLGRGMTLIHIVGLNSRSERIGFRYIVVTVIGLIVENREHRQLKCSR